MIKIDKNKYKTSASFDRHFFISQSSNEGKDAFKKGFQN